MEKKNIKILVIFLFMVVIITFCNSVFARYILETSNILVAETDFDRTPPNLSVSYSNTNITNGDVIVTITSNEKIRNIEGWNLSSDKFSISKVCNQNINEKITAYDLAGNGSSININIDNIDKVSPVVQCTAISNSNTNYPGYANINKEITLAVKVTDNIDIKDIDLSRSIIKVDDTIVNPTIVWEKQGNLKNEVLYSMKLTNINGNGRLSVIFDNGFAIDSATNISEATRIDTNIIIDNIKPTISYSQEIIDEGKVNAILSANEQIQPVNGWTISSNNTKLNKEFVSNVSYEIAITDLAGNKTKTNINVTGATYISLVYASHNSNIGWTYGYGNYDIAGKTSVLTNRQFKTEALAFNVSGNIPSDFVMGRAYVYSHWGSGSIGRCADSGMLYSYGYNPDQWNWKTMNSSDLVNIGERRYFQFGGAGINSYQNTDINGNRPIDVITANEFHYGICGITLALKDYTDYSIVYQIYVGDVGWLSCAANGEETIYSKTSPMSAFRVAFVPSSELQNQIDTWNKDIGKTIN